MSEHEVAEQPHGGTLKPFPGNTTFCSRISYYKLTRYMVEAGGVGINSGTENAQPIDFSRRTKRQKLDKRGQLERIWNTA